MEDISSDRSTDTLTSGVSSAFSAAGEWDTVLNSIHKISDDIQEVWSHIGRRQRPLSCLPSQRKSGAKKIFKTLAINLRTLSQALPTHSGRLHRRPFTKAIVYRCTGP